MSRASAVECLTHFLTNREMTAEEVVTVWDMFMWADDTGQHLSRVRLRHYLSRPDSDKPSRRDVL